jgi:hypothetical protein
MVTFGAIMRNKPKRFSVSLSKRDYKKLATIAQNHRPVLTLQYLVNWSIQKGLLDRMDDRRLYDELANPSKGNGKNE